MAIINPFIERLLERNWKYVPLVAASPISFPSRYKSIPDDLRLFISSFQSLCSDKEDRWLLSVVDYNAVNADGFNWNEFELMSIDAAADDPTGVADTKAFWADHLPLYMRVDGDYEYAAYCFAGANVGHFVHGSAPDFEATSVIARNLPEFQDWILNANS